MSSRNIVALFLVVIFVGVVGVILFSGLQFYSVKSLVNESVVTIDDSVVSSTSGFSGLKNFFFVNKKLFLYGGISLVVLGVVVAFFYLWSRKKSVHQTILAHKKVDERLAQKALLLFLAEELDVPVLINPNGLEFVRRDYLCASGEKQSWKNPDGSSVLAVEFICNKGVEAGTLITVKTVLNQDLKAIRSGNETSVYLEQDLNHFRKFGYTPKKFADYSHVDSKLRALQMLNQVDPEVLDKQKLMFDVMEDYGGGNGKVKKDKSVDLSERKYDESEE